MFYKYDNTKLISGLGHLFYDISGIHIKWGFKPRAFFISFHL